VARDAEWIVRAAHRTQGDAYALEVLGVSELVRRRRAVFLTDLERSIRVIDPAQARLVRDESAEFTSARLYIESLLRDAPPVDERLHIGHRAVMDRAPYQYAPAARALALPRPRLLIADAVGLGKTLEAGILLAELIRRGRGRRILVVTVKSMLTQFQKELWSRFTIPLTRLDSIGIQRVRAQLPADHNPFHFFDKTIISIDTLKQDAEYRAYLEQAYWDVIVLDEAQNVAERGRSTSLRARLARLLSARSDALIMLSATPHDGKAKSFASLMNMLDPTAIADPENYGPQDIKGLFIRRFKKDIRRQVSASFQDRETKALWTDASPEEERAFATLAALKFKAEGPRPSGGMLFKTVLVKALFSSPAACLDTVRRRIETLRRKSSEDHEQDIAALEKLSQEVSRITPCAFSKFAMLSRFLRSSSPESDWNPRDPSDRLVIFSERIETLNFLQAELPKAIGLEREKIAILHGALSDIEQQRIVEEFGKDRSGVRLLIASDVAAEGINLHFLCHRLIHFDVPWSLMVMQQRNGRIDRFGQERVPRITYLFTKSRNAEINGDARILEALMRKDEQAMRNIGDPASLMGLYDVPAEEARTARAMETGESPEEFGRFLDETHDEVDLLALLRGDDDQDAANDPAASIAPAKTLFAGDFEYAETAVRHLIKDEDARGEIDGARRLIEIRLGDDPLDRFKDLPKEMGPVDGKFTLTADKDAVTREIRRTRAEESAWPALQYLWPLHPVMEWLNERAFDLFGRNICPVVVLDGALGRDDAVFLMFAALYNRRSRALVHEEMCACFRKGVFIRMETFDDFRKRSGFGARRFPNNLDREADIERLAELLPLAVEKSRERMRDALLDFRNRMNPLLDARIERLIQWHEKRLGVIAAQYRGEGAIAVTQILDEYVAWVKDNMTLEDNPLVRPVAVFAG
jgi:superfamily II DNA or RNA helicase